MSCFDHGMKRASEKQPSGYSMPWPWQSWAQSIFGTVLLLPIQVHSTTHLSGKGSRAKNEGGNSRRIDLLPSSMPGLGSGTRCTMVSIQSHSSTPLPCQHAGSVNCLLLLSCNMHLYDLQELLSFYTLFCPYSSPLFSWHLVFASHL
jgi:hypothetical protein